MRLGGNSVSSETVVVTGRQVLLKKSSRLNQNILYGILEENEKEIANLKCLLVTYEKNRWQIFFTDYIYIRDDTAVGRSTGNGTYYVCVDRHR